MIEYGWTFCWVKDPTLGLVTPKNDIRSFDVYESNSIRIMLLQFASWLRKNWLKDRFSVTYLTREKV